MKANQVLTEKEAKNVIATLKENGITTRVTRVAKDGYVVKAETVSDEKIKDVVKETALPEDKAKSTEPTLEQQKEIEAEDELKEENASELTDEQVKEVVDPVALPEDKAKPQVAKVVKNKYAKASEHLEDVMAKQDEEEMKEEVSEEELMDEEEVLKTTATLVKAGIAVTVTPMGRKKFALAVANKDLEKAEDVMAGEIYSEENEEEVVVEDKEEIQEM